MNNFNQRLLEDNDKSHHQCHNSGTQGKVGVEKGTKLPKESIKEVPSVYTIAITSFMTVLHFATNAFQLISVLCTVVRMLESCTQFYVY